LPAASFVKRSGRGRKLQFSDRHCKFPTKEITGAQNFNFAPKISQNGAFLPKILHFGMNIFQNGEFFSNIPKFSGAAVGRAIATCHDTTGNC